MHKYIAIPLLSVFCLALTACSTTAASSSQPTSAGVSRLVAVSDGAEPAATSASSSSVPAVSSMIQASSGTTSPPVVPAVPQTSSQASEDGFVNTSLLAAIGSPVTNLLERYGEDYFLYEVGLMAAALEYYSPYICFYFEPGNLFNRSGLPDEVDRELSRQDGLTVQWTELQCEMDAVSHTAVSQDSLRRLFPAGEEISYDLLCEQLQQSPALQHDPYGGYMQRTDYEVGGQWVQLPGGSYTALYTVQGVNVRVGFYEGENGYIAYSVLFGEGV